MAWPQRPWSGPWKRGPDRAPCRQRGSRFQAPGLSGVFDLGSAQSSGRCFKVNGVSSTGSTMPRRALHPVELAAQVPSGTQGLAFRPGDVSDGMCAQRCPGCRHTPSSVAGRPALRLTAKGKQRTKVPRPLLGFRGRGHGDQGDRLNARGWGKGRGCTQGCLPPWHKEPE